MNILLKKITNNPDSRNFLPQKPAKLWHLHNSRQKHKSTPEYVEMSLFFIFQKLDPPPKKKRREERRIFNPLCIYVFKLCVQATRSPRPHILLLLISPLQIHYSTPPAALLHHLLHWPEIYDQVHQKNVPIVLNWPLRQEVGDHIHFLLNFRQIFHQFWWKFWWFEFSIEFSPKLSPISVKILVIWRNWWVFKCRKFHHFWWQ